MMAARWSDSPPGDAARKHAAGTPSSEAKQKDGRDRSEASASASAAASPGPEEEPFSWPGPKTLRLRRTSQGFGFTLRHFIVYPPESAVHNSLKDEDNGSRGRQRNRLEPMDTIFVKQVKEGGPAHGAGLCTGDRIVKVNGESIIGKTYSQVIALIQNSDASLELCVMPKDEDILQLAYSQDAYLKGNDAYSGNAQNIPEPPPICYPRIEVKAAGMAETAVSVGAEIPPAAAPAAAEGPVRRGVAAEKSYRVEIPVPPSPPPQQTPKTPTSVVCDNARTPATPPDPVDRATRAVRAGPSHRTEENRFSPSAAESGSPRPRPLIPSVPGGAQLQHPVHSPSPGPGPVYPDTLSPAVRATAAVSPGAVSPGANHYSPSPTAPSASTSPHQNIDWKNYTTYKDYIDAKRLHTYGCRTIQERLDSLRAAANSSSAYAQQRTPPPAPSGAAQRGPLGSQIRRRSTSNDRGAADASGKGTAPTPLRSVSQERLGAAAAGANRNWPRSASEDALPFSGAAGVPEPRARSCDYLGRPPGEVGVSERAAAAAALDDRLLLCRGEDARASRQASGPRASPHLNRSLTGPDRGGGLSSSAPAFAKFTADSAATARTDGVVLRPSRLPVKTSPSDPSTAPPSFRTATTPLRDQRADRPGSSSPLQLLRGRADSLKMESRSDAGLAARSSSCSGASSKLPSQSSSASCVANGAVAQKPKVRELSSSTGALVRTNGRLSEGVEGPDATVVVLRRDKHCGPPHVRPPSYVLAVNDHQGGAGGGGTRASPPPLLVKAGSADGAMRWRSDDGGGGFREVQHLRRLGDTRPKSGSNDSLDSIPFIGLGVLLISDVMTRR